MNRIKRYWYFAVLGFLVVVLGVSKILFKTTAPIIIPENSWQGITPGTTTTEDLKKQLGEPLKTTQINGKNVYLYPSDTENWENEVTVTDEQKVETIKRYFPSKEENYTSFINQYGPYDYEFFGPSYQAGFSVFVFLNKGVVVVANKESDLVLEVWYFQPTTLEEFLSLLGKDLSQTPPKLF